MLFNHMHQQTGDRKSLRSKKAPPVQPLTQYSLRSSQDDDMPILVNASIQEWDHGIGHSVWHHLAEPDEIYDRCYSTKEATKANSRKGVAICAIQI